MVPNNLNPQWKPFRASMQQLCNCDEHRPLLLEARGGGGTRSARRAVALPLRPWTRACHACCKPSYPCTSTAPSHSAQVFDHDASGGHDLIGRAETSLQGLREAAAAGQALALARPPKPGRPPGQAGECRGDGGGCRQAALA